MADCLVEVLGVCWILKSVAGDGFYIWIADVAELLPRF
jgi:hypothetical protein